MTNTKQRHVETHTPTPWKVVNNNYDDVRIETIVDMPEVEHAYGKQSVISSSEWTFLDEANALFIVKAVNNHEKLVEALKDALELIESCEYGGEPISENNYKHIQQALKEAESEEI